MGPFQSKESNRYQISFECYYLRFTTIFDVHLGRGLVYVLPLFFYLDASPTVELLKGEDPQEMHVHPYRTMYQGSC